MDVYNDITKLIPQRKPMIMVDKLLLFDKEKLVTIFLVTDDNIFVVDGFLQEVALIENIAQTAAAGTGYYAVSNNEKPKKGFIGAVKNFEVYSLPQVGDVLETSLVITAEVLNASVVDGEIVCNGVVVAKAQLKIFLL